jgi:hypothetical protein
MSAFALPEELSYEAISQLYPTTKTTYKRNATNNRTFSSGDIYLPINKMPNSFMNPNTACVNFVVKYNIKNNKAANALNGKDGAFLLGSGYSHFNRQVLKSSNSGVIESIDRVDILAQMILNMTMTPEEKKGSIHLGFNQENNSSNLGYKIVCGALAGQASQDFYVSYSIPLLSCLNANKMIPLFVSDLELDLTMNPTSVFITQSDNDIIVTHEISEITIQYDVLTLESAGFNQLMQQYGGVMSLKSQSWKFGSNTIPASLGRSSYEIVYGHNVNSLKKFLCSFVPANQWDSFYGSSNPNLQSFSLVINSTSYPQQRVDVTNVAEAYTELQKCWGALTSSAHSGSINRDAFAKSSTYSAASTVTRQYAAYKNAKPAVGVLQDQTFTGADANKFYIALDLEQINQLKNEFYSGVSSKGGTNSILLNISEQLTAQPTTVYYFSEYDILLTFDMNQQMIVISE